MSSRLAPPARLIWSLAASGLGTTITANGNSGAWPTPPLAPTAQNAMTPVDLRDVEDLWLTAMCADKSGTNPTLTVSVGQFDDAGNLWPLASLAAVSDVGIANGKQLALGRHGAGASEYFVFSQWGRVSWIVGGTGGPTLTGCVINLWAR